MSGFLSEVVFDIANSNTPFDKHIFILPNKRAGIFLKKYIASHLAKPIFSPQIHSVESFIENVAQIKYATEQQLLFSLYDIYTHNTIGEKDEFHVFAKWAKTLIQDFNEIERELVDGDAIFSYLSAIGSLKNWNLEEKENTLISNYLTFWKNNSALFKKFNTLLLDKGIGYQGLVYHMAEQKIDAYVKSLPTATKHTFIGFNALNGAESSIIQRLAKEGRADIFWDLDSYFLDNTIHDAGFFIRKYQREWNTFKIKKQDHYRAAKTIKIVGVPGAIAQAKYVGSLLDKIQSKEPEKLKNAALVLADESLLNPVLHSLPSNIEKVNVTMGVPLAKTQMANFFTAFLQMYINENDDGWFYKDVLKLLSNPFSPIVLSDQKLNYAQELKTLIHSNNWSYISYKQLALFNGFPQHIFNKEPFSPKQWILSCKKILEKLKKRLVFEKHAKEIKTLLIFNTLFATLETLIDTVHFIKTLKSLKTLFEDLMSSEQLDFQGDPMNGLQIMGVLESRNLDFDTIIMTSVNEGILPSGKNDSSYIPYDVKREFNIPTYKEKDAIYAYHFYRLLQRAKNIHLIYNTEPDVLEGGEKSRFISQLLVDENIGKYVQHSIAVPQLNSSKKSMRQIEKTPLLVDDLKKLAAKGFSPTSLTDYIRNPLEFYKKYILNIREEDKVEENIAFNTFGTVIHDALEELYEPMIGKFLSIDLLSTAKDKVGPIVKKHLVKNHVNTNTPEGKNLILYNVIVKYISNFLDIEISESKKHQIKILALEESISTTVSVEGIDFPVVIKGKLDRVDEKDGQLRIIDYKTGNVISSEVEIFDWGTLVTDHKYSKAFQLLCYAFIFQGITEHDTIEAGIVAIKKTKEGIFRFATKENPRGKKDYTITNTTLSDFRERLEQLIIEILNPNHPLIEKQV